MALGAERFEIVHRIRSAFPDRYLVVDFQATAPLDELLAAFHATVSVPESDLACQFDISRFFVGRGAGEAIGVFPVTPSLDILFRPA